MWTKDSYLYYLLISLVIILCAFFLTKLFRRVFEKTIKISSDNLNVDATNYNFLKNGISFIIYSVAVIIIFNTIPTLRDIGITLIASAGLLAAVLGLASQQAFSNIISGVFIVIFKPFRVGDNIVIQQYRGIIEDITLRHTIIRDYENRRVIIPNTIISNETVVNSTITDSKICNFFEFGISYDSDVDLAINIIKEEALKHPLFIDNRNEEKRDANEEPVVVRVLNWGDSSVNLRAYIWTENIGDGFRLKCDLYDIVKKRFDKEGIEIPFPHRTLVMKTSKRENETN